MEYSIKTKFTTNNEKVKLESFEELNIQDFKNHPDNIQVFLDGKEISSSYPSNVFYIKFTNTNNKRLIRLYKLDSYLPTVLSINIQQYQQNFIVEQEKITLRLSLEEVINILISETILKLEEKINTNLKNIEEVNKSVESKKVNIETAEEHIKNGDKCSCRCENCKEHDYGNCNCDDRCSFDGGKECFENNIERYKDSVKRDKLNIEKYNDEIAEIEHILPTFKELYHTK